MGCAAVAGEAFRNRATLLRLPGVPRLMSSSLRSALIAALLLLSLQLIMLGEETKAPAIDPELATADQLYRAGKFAGAETRYQALLKTDSKLVPAHVGLVRAMLRQQKIDEALEAVNTALAAQPNSAALLANWAARPMRWSRPPTPPNWAARPMRCSRPIRPRCWRRRAMSSFVALRCQM